jgi:thiazole synthase
MNLKINGEQRHFDAPITVEQLLGEIGLDPRKVAVECNLEIVPKSKYAGISLNDGDKLEIVHFIGGGAPDEVKAKKTKAEDDTWEVAGRTFTSRLIIGTGKYEDYEINRLAAEAAGSEMITVAVRRVNLDDPSKPLLVDYLDPKKYTYLPNTAGCFTADDALRTLRLAREAGGWDLVKLEILGEQKTLYPMMPETLETTEILTKEGFQVMVYCSDDPLGCDAVLMNTAIAEAKDPVRMARAMKAAVEAGRDAYLAGRMPKKQYADPSSPLAGLI